MYNNPKSMNILVILRDTIIFYVLLMPLAHYYDVDREHSTEYTSSHYC